LTIRKVELLAESISSLEPKERTENYIEQNAWNNVRSAVDAPRGQNGLGRCVADVTHLSTFTTSHRIEIGRKGVGMSGLFESINES